MILVACGGAIGATLRYLSTNIFKFFYPNFPLSTLFVNITGSFFIGLLIIIAGYFSWLYLGGN